MGSTDDITYDFATAGVPSDPADLYYFTINNGSKRYFTYDGTPLAVRFIPPEIVKNIRERTPDVSDSETHCKLLLKIAAQEKKLVAMRLRASVQEKKVVEHSPDNSVARELRLRAEAFGRRARGEVPPHPDDYFVASIGGRLVCYDRRFRPPTIVAKKDIPSSIQTARLLDAGIIDVIKRLEAQYDLDATFVVIGKLEASMLDLQKKKKKVEYADPNIWLEVKRKISERVARHTKWTMEKLASANRQRQEQEKRRSWVPPYPKNRIPEQPSPPTTNNHRLASVLSGHGITTRKEWLAWLTKYHPDKQNGKSGDCSNVITAGRGMGW